MRTSSSKRIAFLLRKLFIFVLIFAWFLSGWPQIWQNPPIPPEIYKAYAANYLTNSSFTGGTTGWTLSVSTYDSTYYQDTAGSLKTATAVGRNKTATGYAQQTISTNIEAGSTVKLSHYWSKQCVAINCSTNTIQVDIAKPSAPTTWVTIWSNTSIPAFGSATAWTGPSNLVVSSYFNETGQYNFRVYADLKGGNDTSAQSLAWFDNLTLDVTSPIFSVSVTDGGVVYGTLVSGGSQDTTSSGVNDTQTATNNGNVTENFNIKGQNTACPWTLATTAGSEQYAHKFCTTGTGSPDPCDAGPTWNPLTTSYSQTLATGVPVDGTQKFDLQVLVPTSTNCFTQQSVDVTIQAVQP